jgi:hypothetical protein
MKQLYYPKAFKNTIKEIKEWSHKNGSNLNEGELNDVLEAIWHNKIKVNFWISFYSYQHRVEFILTLGTYKNKPLYFQQRNDWGIIYHSIVWEKKDGYILNLNGEWIKEKEISD